jgi:hypothetical protein
MFLRTLIALFAVAAGAIAADGIRPSDSAGAEVARTAELTRAERHHCARKPTRHKRRVCRRRARARHRAPEQPQAGPEEPQLFAPTSFWNAPLAADAPLDSKSSAYVNRLQELLKRWTPYVNTTRYSTPVYTVPADQPMVHVTLDKENSADLQAVFDRVPIPSGAVPAAGTDAHMVVWQPSTDTMWEFWVAQHLSDGWHARYGGRMTDVSTNAGYYTDNPRWGATATSLPLLGGLMRIDELKAGRVDHALAIALPEIRADAWSWPAQRSDGESHQLNAIPEGARFRIDPAVDLSKIPMSPVVRTMAVAAQRYGIVVRDGAGAVAFYAEDPTPRRVNPFLGQDGLFGGSYITDQLRAFPWKHLEVLKTDMTYETEPVIP